jgi:Rieske Fe-S protein
MIRSNTKRTDSTLTPRLAVLIVAALLVVSSASAGVALAAGGTTVSLTPASDSVDVGESTTFSVVVDSANGGVGAAEVGIAVDDPNVAEITSVTVPGSGREVVNIADDGSSVDVEYAFRDTAQTGSVTIIEVTVEGVAAGETGVSLEAAAGNPGVLIFDENGAGYDVTGTNDATLTVAGDEPADPANFQVSNLDAPASAQQGDTIDVSADVENTGGEQATQSVEFRVDTDGDGDIDDEDAVASQDVELDAGASTTVTFEDVDTSGLPVDTLTHGVATEDDSETAQIEITAPPVTNNETTVSLDPETDSVNVSETTTFTVVVDDAQGGVGAAEIGLAVDDPSVAEITDVTVLGSGDDDVVIADDGSSADVDYAFRDTADTGSVPVVEVTVEGVAAGETGLSLEAAGENDGVLVFNEAGIGYNVTGTNGATLTVTEEADEPEPEPASFEVSGLQAPDSAAPGETIDVSATVENTGGEQATKTVEFRLDLNGDGELTPDETVATEEVTVDAGGSTGVAFAPTIPDGIALGEYDHGVFADTDQTATIRVAPPKLDPQFAGQPIDTDNDGTYEDVNGDGQVDEVDSQALFSNLDDPTLDEFEAQFDYNGNGEVDVVDVQFHFQNEISSNGESTGLFADVSQLLGLLVEFLEGWF